VAEHIPGETIFLFPVLYGNCSAVLCCIYNPFFVHEPNEKKNADNRVGAESCIRADKSDLYI